MLTRLWERRVQVNPCEQFQVFYVCVIDYTCCDKKLCDILKWRSRCLASCVRCLWTSKRCPGRVAIIFWITRVRTCLFLWNSWRYRVTVYCCHKWGTWCWPHVCSEVRNLKERLCVCVYASYMESMDDGESVTHLTKVHAYWMREIRISLMWALIAEWYNKTEVV